MKASQIIRLSIGITVLIGLAIAVLTLIPAKRLPNAPGSDTLHHFLAFMALVLPVASVRPRWCLWVVPVAIAYGGMIELIQPLVGRSAEWSDFWANTAGALAGAAIGAALHVWPLRPMWRWWRQTAPAYVRSRSRNR